MHPKYEVSTCIISKVMANELIDLTLKDDLDLDMFALTMCGFVK